MYVTVSLAMVYCSDKYPQTLSLRTTRLPVLVTHLAASPCVSQAVVLRVVTSRPHSLHRQRVLVREGKGSRESLPWLIQCSV